MFQCLLQIDNMKMQSETQCVDVIWILILAYLLKQNSLNTWFNVMCADFNAIKESEVLI